LGQMKRSVFVVVFHDCFVHLAIYFNMQFVL
jgi:hypothetical protein